MDGLGLTEDAVSRGAPRRPTIRDVARLAGVSHETVARHLRGDTRVKPDARDRIAAAVEQLGYRPNLVARAMRNHKTGRLALLLPAGVAISSLEVLAGARAAAHEAGYALELVTLDEIGAGRWARALELADSGLFEGIVSLTPLPMGTGELGHSPITVSAIYDEHMRGIGDLADAARMADIVGGLAARGHRTFLHLAGDYVHTSARCRRQVYLDTIERLGLRSAGVVDCDWVAERARTAVLELPEHSPVTAVVAGNDVLAAGALGGAFQRGWGVPERLSITGWDNNSVGAALTPAFTTVVVDHERLGRRAVAQVLGVLRGRAVAVSDEPLTRVVWRTSTAEAPAWS